MADCFVKGCKGDHYDIIYGPYGPRRFCFGHLKEAERVAREFHDKRISLEDEYEEKLGNVKKLWEKQEGTKEAP